MVRSLVGSHVERVIDVACRGLAPSSVAAPGIAAVDISWRRCLNDFKLDPARDYQPVVLDQTRVKEMQCRHEELLQIARAEMDSLYDQIAGSGFALLLADTSGVILWERVDPALKRLFDSAGLIVGAEWSEQREGTNGIGTCAVESRPITVHQADHFRARHGALSCSAAPIHDSGGRVVAVLDASSVNPGGTRESQMHTVALVNTSARLIEKCLFLRQHRADSVLRFHHRPEFVDLLHDGAIAVAADGTILAADMMGVKLLDATDRNELIGRSIADIFDLSYEKLLATASGAGRRARWKLRDNRLGRSYFASLIEADTQPRLRAPLHARTTMPVVRKEFVGVTTLEELAGQDPQMLRNLRNARRIANSNVSVVIRGATGSGKEVFAKALHLASRRAGRPFIAVNCASIPETLIESELFGYSPGAFTGARREGLRGRIVQSSGGTLFLDEIGDMPLTLQTRLLRVLEEMEVTPLGSETTIKVDMRVICATHRDLRDMIVRGQFREDLYYRLNGITLELPALAEREDKESLICSCIARECPENRDAAIEAVALERLLAYRWPGNIRELRNTVRTCLAICEDHVIRLEDLPREIRDYVPANGPCPADAAPARDAASPISFANAERQALLKVIAQYGGNMRRVAAHFGISRNTVYRKIKRHGIPIPRDAATH
jgi:transcriptional regulator of acetoin/glycerol metabolism